MQRMIFTMREIAQAALFLASLAGGRAAAADRFDASGFDPPADPFGYMSVEGAKALDPGEVHAAGYFLWSHRPFLTPVSRGGAAARRVIEDAYDLDLAGAVGLFSLKTAGVEAGVVVPVTVRELGFALERPNERLRESGLGDVRTDVKLAIFDRDDDAIGLAARVYARWPTGRDVPFKSNERVAVGAAVETEVHLGFLRTGLELGYEWKDGEVRVGGVTVGERVFAGFGLAIAPLTDIRGWEALEIVFEVRHAARVNDPYDLEEEAPLEVGGALRWSGTVFALLGGSAGLTRGPGAPDARAIAAFGITF